MKICFIADGNSIHARRWIEYFCKPENEVHIVSTTYCTRPVAGAIVHNLIAIGEGSVEIDGIGIKESTPAAESQSKPSISRIGRLVPQRVQQSELFRIAYLLYTVFKFKDKAKAVIVKLQPDIVHCLRLPIEGYLGGLVGYRPLALSTWGNDMVYSARKYAICRWLTKKAMSRADLYFSDSLRDKYIAEAFDFSPSSPVSVMPATGGMKFEELPMYHKEPSTMQIVRQKWGISPETNVLVSVSGFKNFYVHTETFVKAIPQIIAEFPDSLFVIDGFFQSPGYSQLSRLAEQLRIESYVRFTNRLAHQKLMDYLSTADFMV